MQNRVVFASFFVVSSIAAASACGSGDNNASASASGASSSGASSSSGEASSSSGTGGSTSSSSGVGGSGGALPSMVALPQLVHGATYVDTLAFPMMPVRVDVQGGAPDAVEVAIDATVTKAKKDASGWVASVDASKLNPGTHALVATSKQGGHVTGSAMGTLVAGAGSLQFTQIAKDGQAYDGHLVHDVKNDRLDFSFVDAPGGKHVFRLAALDGSFARIVPMDGTLNDAADEPLAGWTAFGDKGVGAVYRTAKANDVHWSIKLRALDAMGNEIVPVQNLTGNESAFSQAAAGGDPNGFSAAWLHISPSPDPKNPVPVQVRFARWDLAAQKLVGPITLDFDHPQAMGSMQGPQALEPLAELGVACNASVCLVSYSRDVYVATVDLNIPKLFVATVDLASGTMVGTPHAVEAQDWDTQMFGHSLVALDDGSFALVYTANDTLAAVNPKSPCDMTIERDLLFAMRFDAKGMPMSAPKAIFDFEGTREYPRIAPHPAGFAMFWEDQRSECNANGHIRMAANVVPADLSKLSDPYLEIPGSIALPPEFPSIAVAGTNGLVAWSDNRHGNGLADIQNEIYFDTYWRE